MSGLPNGVNEGEKFNTVMRQSQIQIHGVSANHSRLSASITSTVWPGVVK